MPNVIRPDWYTNDPALQARMAKATRKAKDAMHTAYHRANGKDAPCYRCGNVKIALDSVISEDAYRMLRDGPSA